MIVASALPLRYRAIVDFHSTAERNRIIRFLEGLEGQVAVMENVPRAGRMVCDFANPGERDAFSTATQRGVPAPAVLLRKFEEAALAA